MKFEDFTFKHSSVDNKPARNKVGKSENKLDPPDPGRRKFIKDIAKAAAVIAAGGTIGGLLLESQEQNKERNKKNETAKKEEKEKNKADIYLAAYYKIAKTAAWKDDLFTDDLFIAQQLQESKYDKAAESKIGAVGVMQNTRSSIQDVSRYLAKLKRYKNFSYNGKGKLNREEIEEIKWQIKQNADHSRAFGKVYMAMLGDDEHGYGLGDKKYKKGNISGAQKEILAAYNGGLGRIAYRDRNGIVRKPIRLKPENQWPDETREYCDKIFNYMQRLKNIKETFKEEGINIKNLDAMRLAREMDKYDSRDRYKILSEHVQMAKRVL